MIGGGCINMRWRTVSGSSAMGMVVFCFQGKLQREIRSFAYHAFHLDLSAMRLDDCLYITESESETFYVVQIAGMCAVKLLEDAAHGLFAHADPIVFDTDNEVLHRAMGDDADQQIFLRIFDRIVDEVGDDIYKVNLVGFEPVILCIQLQFGPTALAFQLEMEILHGFLDKDMRVQWFPVQLLFLPVQQGGLQDRFNLFIHPLVLFLDDPCEIFRFFAVMHHLLVPQRIYGKRDGRQRRFELMGHVVDEIVLYLTELFLPDKRVDGHIERGDDDQRKKNSSADHSLHFAQYNILEIGYDDCQDLVGQNGAAVGVFGSLQRAEEKFFVGGILDLFQEILRLQLGRAKEHAGIAEIGRTKVGRNGKFEPDIMQSLLIKSF